jgi:hypothetical protein
MLLYVSGVYSNGDIDHNIAEARKISIALWEARHWVLCPHLNTAHFEIDCKATYEDYVMGDLRMLESCDGIVMIPGWEKSEGARREYQHAENLNIPIWEWPDYPSRSAIGLPMSIFTQRGE